MSPDSGREEELKDQCCDPERESIAPLPALRAYLPLSLSAHLHMPSVGNHEQEAGQVHKNDETNGSFETSPSDFDVQSLKPGNKIKIFSMFDLLISSPHSTIRHTTHYRYLSRAIPRRLRLEIYTLDPWNLYKVSFALKLSLREVT